MTTSTTMMSDITEKAANVAASEKMTENEKVAKKVKYIGVDDIAIKRGKIYEAISIEKGWYRIMTELDESYLFPPKFFEIVE